MPPRLVPVDYDPFAESHVSLTPVDYDPFDVAAAAARMRAAGTAPPPDPRDVAAEQRRQDRNRGIEPAPQRSPQDAQRLNRIGAGREQIGDREALTIEQQAPGRQRELADNTDAANPDVRNTMAYIGTRLHQLNPQQYPWLFRNGAPLAAPEIADLISRSSDEIAGMSPQDATNYLFGRPEMRPANIGASLGQRTAPPRIQDPLLRNRTPGPDGSYQERSGWDLADSDLAQSPEQQPDTWGQRVQKFLHRTGDLFSESFNGLLMREAEYHTGPASYSAAGDQAFDSSGNQLYHTVQSEGQRLVVESRELQDTPGRRAFLAAQSDLQRNNYNFGGATDSYLTQTAESLVQMLPVIAAGIVTRGRSLEGEVEAAPGTLLGRMAQGFGKEVSENRGSLGTLYEQQAGQQYGQSRAQGRDPTAAMIDSNVFGLAEAIPEALPMGSLMRPGGKFLPRLLRTAGFEGASEMMTQAVEDAYSAGIIGQDMTWGQAWRDIRDAGIIGGLMGGGMTVVEAPFHRPGAHGEAPPVPGEAPDLSAPLPPTGSYRPGIREAAAAAPPNITPEDQASPLPTELIAQGKKAAADALATTQADQVIGDNIGYGIGDHIAVTIGGQTRTGQIQDAFTEEDPETGTHHGAVIGWHDGTTARERFSDLRDAGARIERQAGAPDDIVMAHIGHAENAAGDARRNPLSTASGPFQFLDSTFRNYYRQVYGTDPGEHPDTSIKNDPAVQRRLMVAMLADTRAALQRAGQEATAGNLYLGHFLGQGGAVTVLRNPNAPIESLVDARVMRANPFLRGMTGGDVAAWAARRMGGHLSPEQMASAGATPSDEAQPDFSWIDQPVDQAGAPAPGAAAVTPAAPLTEGDRGPAIGAPSEASAAAESTAPIAPQVSVERNSAVISNASERDIARVNAALPENVNLIPRSDGSFTAPARYRDTIQTILTGDGTRDSPITATTAEHVDQAAANAVQPTEGQAEAGNYQKGHVRVQGLDISIETPRGEERSGTGPDGTPWSVTMPDHYGYVKRTTGADAEQVDVYVGPQPQSPRVFVVDQNDHETGQFDEHKAMIGYPSEDAARAAYHAAFSDGKGPDRVGAITEMSVPQFKEWLGSEQTAPAADGASNQSHYEDLFARAAKASGRSLEAVRASFRRAEANDPIAAKEALLNTIFSTPQPSEDIGQFDPTPHVAAMRQYVANSTGSLNDTEKMGKALGLTSEQTHRVMGALAARRDSGIRMTKGRPAGTRRILLAAAQTINGKKRAARYRTITYRPAVPSRFQRIGTRTAPLHFMEWVRAQGGVKSDRHDLRNVGGLARHPGVINNKTGLSLDQLGERMAESGWAHERPTESDVLEMLSMGSNAKVYRPEDGHALTEAQNGNAEAAKTSADEETLRTLRDDFGLTLDDDGISRAVEYMSQGKAPIQALTEAANDAAVDTLETGASETGNDALLDVPESAHGGVHDETAGAGDSRSAEAVAGPESQPQDAQERADANAESDQAGEAAGKGVATDLLGKPEEQPTPKAEVPAETQPDMLGTQAGDERRTLERKGEGRKQSEATQKAPGSEGGLFDNTAKQGDLTQPESTDPVEKAKAALQSALDALNGKTAEAPVEPPAPANDETAETAPPDTPARQSLLRDWQNERDIGRKPGPAWIVRRIDDKSIVTWSVKRAAALDAAYRQHNPEELEIARVLPKNLEDGVPIPASNIRSVAESEQPQYQRRLNEGDDPVFYSALERAVEASTTQRASAEQWAATLSKATGVKKEELEWSGVFDWLDMQKGAVSRDDLLNLIREGGIKVEEHVLGAPPNETEISQQAQEWIDREIDGRLMEVDTRPHFAEQAPNGEGHVVYGPWADESDVYDTPEEADAQAEKFNDGFEQDVSTDIHNNLNTAQYEDQARHEIQHETAPQFGNWSSDPSNDSYRELLITLPVAQGGNPERAPATHWDQDAVVAHARFMDKTDAAGRRVLFVEEIQSDWHQKGRDEGYEQTLSQEEMARRDEALKEAEHAYNETSEAFAEAVARELDKEASEAEAKGRTQGYVNSFKADARILRDQRLVARVRGHDAAGVVSKYNLTGRTAKEFQAMTAALLQLQEATQAASRRVEGSIPEAPFKSSWPALMLKRLIRWAADNSTPASPAFAEATKPESPGVIANDFFGGRESAVPALKAVDAGMIAALQNNEIRRAVVADLPVYVMDNLARLKRSADDFLRNPNMVVATLPVDQRRAMFDGLLGSLRNVGARLRAELTAARNAGRDLEILPALKASELDPSVVVGLLSPQLRYHDAAALGADRASEAGAPAVAAATGSRGVSEGHLDAATLADFLNWHDRLRGGTGNSYQAPSGYERVAWTTGDEQNERYNLEKHIGRVLFEDNSSGGIGRANMEGPTTRGNLRVLSPDNNVIYDRHVDLESNPTAISDVIGHELADRLLAAAPTESRSAGLGVRRRLLENVDLKTGGEGMRGFYDRNLVNIANDLIKKHGGKVGTVHIPSDPREVARLDAQAAHDRAEADQQARQGATDPAAERRAEAVYDLANQAQAEADRIRAGDPHPGFDISPALADAARSGFPLFQRAQSTPVTEAEAGKVATRLQAELDRLGISDRIALKVANGLLTDKGAQGAYFRRAISVSLDMATHPMATLSHESIHAMRALGLFTDSEWSALKSQAWADPGVAAFVKRGYALSSDAKRDEEAVAEFYARWRSERMQAKGFAAKAFQRLLDFVHAVGRAVAWVRGQEPGAGAALRNIERGRIGARETGAGLESDTESRQDAGNFARWFGKSKVVDENGAPLVVYHGGPSAIEAFDRSASVDGGFHFGTREQAQMRAGRGPPLTGAYLSIENPRRSKDMGANWKSKIAAAKAAGHDGIVYLNRYEGMTSDVIERLQSEGLLSKLDGMSDAEFRRAVPEAQDSYIAFEPTQIKSTANRGTFDPTDPRIMYQGGGDGFNFDPAQPERTMTQAQRAELEARQQQSKARRPDQANFGSIPGGLFGNEEEQGSLFQLRTPATVWNDQLNRARDLTGAAKTIGARDRIAEKFERFRINFQDRVLPILRTQTAIERVIGRELTDEEQPYRQEALYTGRVGDQFEKLADGIVEPLFEAMQEHKVSVGELESYLYARHAPERNSKLKQEGVDDGSGMSDIEAAAILNRIDQAGKTDALKAVATWFDKLVAFGLDTRVEGGLMSAEQAAQWRGQWKHYAPLKGHLELPEEERPNIGQSGFSVKGPESKRAFGRKSLAQDILAHAIVQAQEGVVRAEKNRVAVELYNLAKANPDPNFWQIHKVVMKKRINKETGLVETYPVTQTTADDMKVTVNLKIDGKAKRVTFNRSNRAAVKAAEAMRHLNEPELNVQVLQHINQWLSRVNTMLSPDFIWRNALRDLETATANLSQFDMKGLRRDVIASYPNALSAAERGAFKRPGDSEWDQAWKDYSAEGGRIAFNQMDNVDDLRKEIAKRFERIQASALSPKEAGLRLWGALKWTFDKIEKANQGVENATRLAVYKNLVDRGVSKKQAAFVAKEITVNFNRRGVYGALVNSLYLFANASTQGSARMVLALKHRRVQKIAGSMIVAGAVLAMMNAAMGGNDDDGVPYYDKISEFDKQSNLIFMIPGSGGRYIKIPMAYGYSIFPDLGRQLVDVFRGHTHPLDAAGHWLNNALNSFNPIGGQESLANFIAPTIVDPLVDLYVDNRDFADRPIMPDQPAYGPPRPDSQRFWPSVPPYYRALTDFLNTKTGGDQVTPGWIDVSPETLQYLANQATGSAGATLGRLGSIIGKTIDGDPTTNVEINDIPVLRTMVGAKPSWYDRSAFYARLQSVQNTVEQDREYHRLGDQQGQQHFVAGHRDVLELHAAANQAQHEMQLIRRAKTQAEIAYDAGRINRARYDAIRTAAAAREERLFSRWNAIYLRTVHDPVQPQR